jgi:hypothetical protein
MICWGEGKVFWPAHGRCKAGDAADAMQGLADRSVSSHAGGVLSSPTDAAGRGEESRRHERLKPALKQALMRFSRRQLMDVRYCIAGILHATMCVYMLLSLTIFWPQAVVMKPRSLGLRGAPLLEASMRL